MNNETLPVETGDPKRIGTIASEAYRRVADFADKQKIAAVIALLTLAAPGCNKPSDNEGPLAVPDGIESIDQKIAESPVETDLGAETTPPTSSNTEISNSESETKTTGLSNKILELEKERNPNMVVSVSVDKIKQSGDYVLALVNVVPQSSAKDEGFGNDDVTTYLYRYSKGNLEPIKVDMDAVTEAVDAAIENPDLLDEVYALRPPEVPLADWIGHLPELFDYWPGRK